MEHVYLDHNATTPLDPRVGEAMADAMSQLHWNSSSVHYFGQKAREAVEGARERVAALLGAAPAEIVFTSSGTESNNAVIFSSARRAGFKGHLVVSSFEHPSVETAMCDLEMAGVEVTRVDPGASGVIDADAMIAAIQPGTGLVCLMLANNEIGTIQPVGEVAIACRDLGVPILCDAVQAVGKIPVQVHALSVDYLSLGAHKFYGPLGAAALWIRQGQAFDSFLVGGSQERFRRAGTVNVPAVVGMGLAAEMAMQKIDERAAHLQALRDQFEAGLGSIPDVVIHGAGEERLPNTSNIAVLGVEGESLMIRLDLHGYAVSTGSACSSGKVEPSAALMAMGLPLSEALSSLRISFGVSNSESQVGGFLKSLAEDVVALRRVTPKKR
ncbi:MAG: cysteine desulfurase family protein [Thermoanaerobaculia bacterium]